jgi:signal transduction histidine kinase
MVEHFRVPAPPRLPLAAALGLALLLPVAAYATAVAAQGLFENAPFLLFVLAVLGTAWCGGILPALASVGASAFLSYAFILRASDPSHHLSAPAALAVFAPVATVVAAMTSAAREAVQERDRAAEILRESDARERARAVELQAALRIRDTFLSIASHELKTPLTALKLSAQGLLRASAGAPGPATRAAELVLAQVTRLTTLVNALLDVSQMNEGRLRLEPVALDLASLVREVAGRLAGDAVAAGSTLEVDAPAPVEGRFDRLRVEQVVTNLLSNAIKYGEGRPVTVRVDGDAGAAEVLVRDRGIGIAAGEQARIFERFERADGARGYGGFGLGLWIVRELVTAHGGSIAVESAPGAGSTFRVRLPRGGPPARDAPAA